MTWMATDRMTDAPVPREEHVPTADQFVVMHGDWDTFERVLAARGDHSAPRIAYLDGVVVLMSPSYDRESIQETIGHLLVQYCLDQQVEVHAVGSWTLKAELEKAGVEPDGCFIFGRRPRTRSRPDLAVEVEWTSGGIDKLEIYRRLGVREVWHWKQDVIRVYVLVGNAYEERERSEALPDLDVELVRRFATTEPVTTAITQFRAALATR